MNIKFVCCKICDKSLVVVKRKQDKFEYDYETDIYVDPDGIICNSCFTGGDMAKLTLREKIEQVLKRNLIPQSRDNLDTLEKSILKDDLKSLQSTCFSVAYVSNDCRHIGKVIDQLTDLYVDYRGMK